MVGLIAIAVVVTSTVCPSGSAERTLRAARLPPAPPRFSMMTDWPHLSLSFCATNRATVSANPPAAKPTTKSTFLAGYFVSWAWLATGPASVTTAVTARMVA